MITVNGREVGDVEEAVGATLDDLDADPLAAIAGLVAIIVELSQTVVGLSPEDVLDWAASRME